MEEDFYKARLKETFGIDVLIPDEDDRRMVHEVIYKELCLGNINSASKQTFVEIVDRLAGQGAQGVILGCTEIGLLINQGDTMVPLYDTTLIHAGKAVDLALSEAMESKREAVSLPF